KERNITGLFLGIPHAAALIWSITGMAEHPPTGFWSSWGRIASSVLPRVYFSHHPQRGHIQFSSLLKFN
uniref:Uncharacterized protein n=1 Tax=Pavo cristatus TaxID=9049 RepID=A0A8C9FW35_PAVCR